VSAEWTYGGDPGSNPLDLVRHLIGDTTQTRHSPTDTEVEYWIGLNTKDGTTDGYAAASAVAKLLARRFRRLSATTQVKIGDMSLTNDYAKLADQYDDMAADLGAGQNQPGDIGGPLWGGADRTGAFSMGLMDNQ
jgi:hypothetical protein